MLNLSGRELRALPDPPLSRRQYLRVGLALMTLKYAVDAALVLLATNVVWTPLDYVLSLANLANSKAAAFTPGLSIVLLIWTLPFLWVGVLLSVRRAQDAGLPAWIVVAFFIPVANYALMVLLAVRPTAPPRAAAAASFSESDLHPSRALAAGVLAGVATGGVSVVVGIRMLHTYGFAVFLLTPFVMGMVGAFVTRRLNPYAPLPLNVVLSTMGVMAGVLLLIALEGLGCIVMAAPIAIPIALLGGMVGHSLASPSQAPGNVALLLLLVPAGHGLELLTAASPVREVHSAIHIAADPERVWQHVVSFEEIRTPPPWYFRVGLAYPIRARIAGSGVGAVRHCEFTTGAFVEPITAWDAPRRLAFDVIAQPAPLQEWSPYRTVYAPHLKGFFRTTRGEFRLIALPDGRTRLEGRTWYTLRMQPQGYWTIVADTIVHQIHVRVLEHIKRETESGL